MPTDVREIGKSRSQRINIDYYRQKNWLTRSRGLLALAAVILAAAYCVYVYGSGGAMHLSTGPVASAHASFESDCQQCHLDFTPISGDALKFTSAEALVRLEDACQKCHRVSDHFRDSLTPEFAAVDQHCSGCHTDHQGRDHDMVKMSNGKCVQCHGDLPSTCKSDSKLRVRNQVQGFTEADHGTFISLTQGDPGRIKFDHAQHMMPGQVDAGAKGGFTISMLDPAMREAYRKSVDGVDQSDEALVTLECKDCHQFAGVPQRSQAVGKVQVGDDELGRHIEPIAFTKHCAACHSMTVAGQKESTLPLPHAAPWSEMEVLMASKLIGGRELGQVRMPIDAIKEPPRLGESVGSNDQLVTPAAIALSLEQARKAFEASLSAGRTSIKQRCEQCHEDQDLTDESIEALRANKVPPLVPERWLTRGIYDHAAHRKIECAFCHAQAYPNNSNAASQLEDSETVMIRGIESCDGCHRSVESEFPASLSDANVVKLLGGQSNWASDTCTECHRYHWKPPAPPASLPESAPMPVAVRQFDREGSALIREAIWGTSRQ
jgi:hypothetical protein